MKQRVVQIVGGSASTAYALEESKASWPELIGKKYPNLEIRYINQPLMKIGRAHV